MESDKKVKRQKDADFVPGPITHTFVFHFTVQNITHEVCKDWKGMFFSFVRDIVSRTWKSFLEVHTGVIALQIQIQ